MKIESKCHLLRRVEVRLTTYFVGRKTNSKYQEQCFFITHTCQGLGWREHGFLLLFFWLIDFVLYCVFTHKVINTIFSSFCKSLGFFVKILDCLLFSKLIKMCMCSKIYTFSYFYPIASSNLAKF